MENIPQWEAATPSHVSSFSLVAAGGGQMLEQFAGAAANLTWVANLAVYIPLFLPVPFVARRLFTIDAISTTAQNIDIGVYSADGVRLVSTGSTAKIVTGATTPHYVTLSPEKLLPAGRYYLAYSNDHGVINAVRGRAVIVNAARMAGILQESAFPLPAAMTPAVISNALYPLIGISSTT